MSFDRSAPVRFSTDDRHFGRVNFPKPKGRSRIPLEPLQAALQACLNVTFEAKRERLFGPKIQSFMFMGERIKIRMLESGDASLDLATIDDDVREIIVEHLRQSHDFEAL